ncbi:MAG: type II CAAX endopeptidase family protein [Erysipelotrichaceae bacterium]|nr:type II CAAX endopeptidase family protein [Erysipelotrichaceae bacterium]
MVEDQRVENGFDPKALKETIASAIKTCLLLFFVQFIVMYFGSSFIVFLPIDYASVMRITTIWELVTSVVAALCAILYGARKFNIKVRKLLDVKQFSWKWLGKGVAMHYSISFLSGLIIVVLNLFLALFFNSSIPEVEVTSPNAFYLIMNLLSVGVVAGVSEEIIFRGMICNSLARYNKGFAVVVSALIFSIMHMNLDQGIPAFFVGICFGYIYLRSGSLLVTISLHVLNNFFAVLITAVGDGAMATILSVLLVVLVVCGCYLWYKERKEVSAMITLCSQATKEWATLFRSCWFWFVAAAFALLVFLSLFISIFTMI